MSASDIQLEQIASGSWRVTGGTGGGDRIFRLREHALTFARLRAISGKSKLIDCGGEVSKSRWPECPEVKLVDGAFQRVNCSSLLPANAFNEQSEQDLQGAHTHTATIAVLFVDIVGFSRFVTSVSLFEAIATLQSFCALIERSVEAHNGVLEKYLGDGAMVTFGTKNPSPCIALNAVRCARSMLLAVKEWNIERFKTDMPPLQIEIGAHYGTAVLGSIGVHRIEFAVIGDSVNIANRLEAMAHDPETAIVLSKELLDRACFEASGSDPALEGFLVGGKCQIGGFVDSIAVATHERI